MQVLRGQISMRPRKTIGGMASITGFIFSIATICLIQIALTAKEKVYYVDAEHVNTTYWNPKYIRSINTSTRRYGRSDPIHYMHVHVELLMPFGNDVAVDGYMYEFLSNEYRRSFVEVHYKLCDLILRDNVLSPIVKKFLPKICPVPKGVYHFVNMSVPDFPLLGTFPFPKGRAFLNLTIKDSNGVRERVADGYSDVTIKTRWR